MADQHVGQFVSDGCAPPVQIALRDANDDNIMFGKGHAACPGWFVEDGILHIIGVGVNVNVNGFVGLQAGIVLQAFQPVFQRH